MALSASGILDAVDDYDQVNKFEINLKLTNYKLTKLSTNSSYTKTTKLPFAYPTSTKEMDPPPSRTPLPLSSVHHKVPMVNNGCCVFIPANGFFACRSLIVIRFFSVLTNIIKNVTK